MLCFLVGHASFSLCLCHTHTLPISCSIMLWNLPARTPSPESTYSYMRTSKTLRQNISFSLLKLGSFMHCYRKKKSTRTSSSPENIISYPHICNTEKVKIQNLRDFLLIFMLFLYLCNYMFLTYNRLRVHTRQIYWW